MSTTIAGWLAQSDTSVGEVIVWSIGLLIVLVAAMAGAARLRRRIKQDDAPTPALGFTLSDLRQMHRAGQLTDDEFNRAKEKIVAASQAAAERIPAATTVAAGTETGRDSVDAIRARRLAREAQQPGGLPPAAGEPDGRDGDDGHTGAGGTAGQRPVT
jgi:hypothetical protein